MKATCGSHTCKKILLSGVQRVKRLPGMWETQVRSLGWEDPLEKEMATHSRTLAWKIPWTEKPSSLQSMRSQRVGHDWATFLSFPFWCIQAAFSNTSVCDSWTDTWTINPLNGRKSKEIEGYFMPQHWPISTLTPATNLFFFKCMLMFNVI